MSLSETVLLQDPQAIDPFSFDWTGWLAHLGAGVVISTSSWVVAPSVVGGLVLTLPSIVAGARQTQVVLSGGTVGVYYLVTNHITASDGSANDQTVRVLVWDSAAPAPPPIRSTTPSGLALVTDAFAELDVFGAGDPVPADDAAFALGRMNQILALWNAGPHNLSGDTFGAFNVTANRQPHTIGPTGDYVVGTRPQRIVAAYVIVGTGTSAVRTPVDVRSRDWWAGLSNPAFAGATPTDLYYDPAASNGAIYLWPAPSAAAVLELQLHRLLAQLVLTDVVIWPPGVEAALAKTLAEDLATPYHKAVPPQLAKAAAHARAVVFGAQSVTPRLRTADVGMPGGGGLTWYDWRTGDWRS